MPAGEVEPVASKVQEIKHHDGATSIMFQHIIDACQNPFYRFSRQSTAISIFSETTILFEQPGQEIAFLVTAITTVFGLPVVGWFNHLA
jgi:hypothetical protein